VTATAETRRYGREKGFEGLLAFTRTKTVAVAVE
jgi:hypothetical protein